MAEQQNDIDDLKGHRSRLRGRLLGDGGDALQDYELLEYLLGLATPRYDTKPIAKDLLREFGSIGGVLTADPAALVRIRGIGEISIAAIKIAQATALRLLQSEVAARPVLANWQALLDYLRARVAHEVIEQFRVLYLDTKNQLIRDEEQSEGTIDQAPVYVREVIKRSLELNAAAIILVHNHPSGDPSPSRADIEITRTIAEAGKRLGISVHDHIVMGTSGYVSLRAQGLI